MKRTIEITDVLQESVDSAKSALLEHVVYNADDVEAVRDYIHEAADNATPIYYHEIYDTFHYWRNDLEKAYDDAGIYGENEKPENYEQVCICCYIEQALQEYFQDELEPIIEKLSDYVNQRSTKIDTDIIAKMLNRMI